MRKGILGDKGSIHIHFGEPITEEIGSLPDDLHKNELIARIGGILDAQIIENYKTQKSNQIAYDILKGNDLSLKSNYTEKDKAHFLKEIDDKVSTMAGESAELKNIFLDIYARPCMNKVEVAS